MHVQLLLTLASALLTAASPVDTTSLRNVHQKRAAPTVQIPSGTIVGETDLEIDSFIGIPFAQPPVGNLRLRPPQPIVGSLGTVNAVGIPTACPQMNPLPLNLSAVPGDVVNQILGSPLFQAITKTGEDCLTLNVQRPSTASADSRLPVLVWIFGGGFEFGSTQMYGGRSIVSRSIDLDAPVVYVEINYRLNGFGFLGGKELQAEGSTNLGLRDQRLALEWIQDNIAAFGGDPTKVTIWGESAGAISAFDHTIINGGENSYKGGSLFRGVIMDSGSVIPTDTVAGPKAQNVYNTVVAKAGCSSSSDTLACLRNVPYGTFLEAINSLPGFFSYRSVDIAYQPRPDPADNFFSVSPEISLMNNAFAKVPVIIGDQNDEGTLFALAQSNITNTDQLVRYLASFLPTTPNAESLMSGLVATYPDDPSAGSPFGTSIFWNLYPEFKRLAAILGDVAFTLTRRIYLAQAATQVPTWSYLSTYFYGTPVLGTFHVSDVIYAFGLLGPAPIPTQSIQRYYISFVNHLDPNALGVSAPLIQWPQWTDSGRGLLNFGLFGNSIIKDDFRETSYQYLSQFRSSFRL